MKSAVAAVLLAALAGTPVRASRATPIGKVLQLLSDLQTKIVADGEGAKKVYDEFAEFCDDRSKELGYEIKTGKAQAEKLEASISREASLADSLSMKREELSAGVAKDEAGLKLASASRAEAAATFAAEEKELTEATDVLQRAVRVLEREMQKGGAALVQLRGASGVAEALGALVEASALGAADGQRLQALLQRSRAADQDEAAEPGAPSAAVYESHGGGILETLEDLLEKAEAQLAASRAAEAKAQREFELLKQGLEDSIRYAEKDLAAAKKGLAGAGERKAEAEGALAVASKDLEADEASLADLKRDCVAKAEDHEAEVASRNAELKDLAEAKRIIAEETGGAERVAYGASLLQLRRAGPNPGVRAAHAVRELAHRQRSPALAQLASRLLAAAASGAVEGEEPFAKVKGLIADMIAKLEDEADAEASHKAFCDKELAEAEAKQADKAAEVEKASAQIDQLSAKAAQLKEEIAGLQKGLAELAASQAEMDKLRSAEHADYAKSKADLEQGLQGVRLALKILREYYAQEGKAHAAAGGAGASIIGLLEVVESDLSKLLVEMTSAEEAAQKAYDSETKENEIEKAAKGKDVAYKAQKSTGLDQAVGEVSSDRGGVQTELGAVLGSLASLKKQCTAKAEAYGERKARREAELAGLKEALAALEGEASLLQRAARTLRRPVQRHRPAA